MDSDQSGLRTRLVHVAMEMLAEGADALSLRSVARGAGVSAMAPYRHFPDKAALLRAVADRGFEMLREALEAGDRGGGREALVEQGLAYFRFAGEHPALFRLMFSNLCAPPAPNAGPGAHAVLARRVESIVTDPAAAATATVAAWAIVHGLALLALDGTLPIDAGQARSVLTLFAQGLS